MLLCQFRFAKPLAIVIFFSTNFFTNFFVISIPFEVHTLEPIIDIMFVCNSFLFPSMYICLGGFGIFLSFSGYSLSSISIFSIFVPPIFYFYYFLNFLFIIVNKLDLYVLFMLFFEKL